MIVKDFKAIDLETKLEFPILISHTCPNKTPYITTASLLHITKKSKEAIGTYTCRNCNGHVNYGLEYKQ